MPRTETPNALLDAHVAWIIARLEGPAFEAEVTRHLDGFLSDIRKIKLKDVIRARDIHDTVQKYAAELDLGGAMPELVGDIVRHLFDLKIHEKTRLVDVLPDKHFRELLDKLLEFSALREMLIQHAVHSPVFSSMITDLLYQGIVDYTTQNTKRAERLPGARSAMKLGKAVVTKARPDISTTVSDGIKKQVRRNAEDRMRASESHLNSTFESEDFRDMLLDAWDDYKTLHIAEIRRHINSLDLEEFFVILYEYWRHLRQTEIFSTMVNAGIDRVLAMFGDMDLATVLKEIGITREMMIDDALRFAPPVIQHLKKRKMLQPALRRSLEGFYNSQEVIDILDKHVAN